MDSCYCFVTFSCNIIVYYLAIGWYHKDIREENLMVSLQLGCSVVEYYHTQSP